MKRTLKKFDDLDVIRVFLAIGDATKASGSSDNISNVSNDRSGSVEGLIKRMDICYRTLVGEGSVKNILKLLSDKALVETEKRGNRLTAAGKDVFEAVRQVLTEARPVSADIFNDGMKAYAAVLKKYDGKKTEDAYAARDHAIRRGCWSAMVLVCRDGKLKIPSADREFDELKDELGVENNDAVLAVSSKAKRRTEKGILAIARYLNEELHSTLSRISETAEM